ncbi:SDR family NAD(P)-dependent oxidoreductase [Streptomyces sp. ISL-11]|uniref:NAD-dependent epimerase/dehydratase family protein n=1 Tax=Streptomyces sp. ISL-11 TaxID=2819174 RepID=UPI0027E3F3A9|nr:SDR family NAD(P)-dependent oxidoreductase [Streptomyces sp. ISL-11]
MTGGLGFIGSHFVEELLDRGAEVICAYRTEKSAVIDELPTSDALHLRRFDLLDADALAAAVDSVTDRTGTGVDAIINCATLDGNMKFLLEQSGRMLDENARMVSNVLNFARSRAVSDTVLVSSAEIYSYAGSHPMREEDDHRRHMEYSPNGYRLSKMFTEVMADLYRGQYGMNIYTPRPSNVYGPRDDFEGSTNHVIPNMLARLAAGRDIEIWGDGSQTRTFIHVQDLVRAVLCMVADGTHHTLNIGTEEAVSIRDLAHLVAATAGHAERVRMDPDKPVGASRRALDLEKLHTLADFTPRTLEDGLLDTVRWFQKHQAQLQRAL